MWDRFQSPGFTTRCCTRHRMQVRKYWALHQRRGIGRDEKSEGQARWQKVSEVVGHCQESDVQYACILYPASSKAFWLELETTRVSAHLKTKECSKQMFKSACYILGFGGPSFSTSFLVFVVNFNQSDLVEFRNTLSACCAFPNDNVFSPVPIRLYIYKIVIVTSVYATIVNQILLFK